MTLDKIYNYFERYPNLHVLFVFDPFGDIEPDLVNADWKDGFVFACFDGGWFKAKYAIENEWKDKKVVMLFRQANPTGSQQSMLEFPLMDVLAANMDYKVDDYQAFVQQYNVNPKYVAYIQRHVAEMQQQRVAKIMEGNYDAGTFNLDIANRGFISSYLGAEKLLDWNNIIIRLIIQDAGDKLGEVIKGFTRNNDALMALNDRLTGIFGIEFGMNDVGKKMKKIAESLKYNSIVQNLAIDKLRDDYHGYRVTNMMSLQQLNEILETPLQPIHKKQFAMALEQLSADVKESEILKCYGVGANYNKMTPALASPIVREMLNLVESDSLGVLDRMREVGQKLAEDDSLQQMIRFVTFLARYYQGKRDFGTLKLNTPIEYIAKYTQDFYKIDNIYRHVVESLHGIDSSVPNYDAYFAAKSKVDLDYANLCNLLNMEWVRCVKETHSELNNLPGQIPQDHFYNKYRNNDVKQVVVISDALRYEVAQELMGELSKGKHYATISHMVAMLPTETKYCKNALLPHNSLHLNGDDMQVDYKVLTTLDQRSAHLQNYVKDGLCANYADIDSQSQDENRELFKRPMVYVYHNTIDDAGHNGDVVEACSKSVQQLAKLVNSLHATFNVANVIVTADHGFLYNDTKFEDKDKHTIAEDCSEKKTRYYLTSSADDQFGITKFELAEVSGMKESMKVAVPTGTNRMAAAGGYQFAHGGASLQEMIVPVIVSKRKHDNTKTKVGVVLVKPDLSMVSSRLKFQLIQAEAVSMGIQERTVKCGLYFNDDLVTDEKKILLNSQDGDHVEHRIFDVELKLSKPISASVLQLRVFDVEDDLNPLIKENVKNNTLIDQDF